MPLEYTRVDRTLHSAGVSFSIMYYQTCGMQHYKEELCGMRVAVYLADSEEEKTDHHFAFLLSNYSSS